MSRLPGYRLERDAQVLGVRTVFTGTAEELPVFLPRGEYQRNRQLACWSEGICPACLRNLTLKRFCRWCQTVWHCRRDPMPEAERSRVRGRWQEHATREKGEEESHGSTRIPGR